VADGVFVSDKKLVISFSVVTLSSEPFHETANKLQYENRSFILIARVIAERFKQSSI
jgi:hypothetical protein